MSDCDICYNSQNLIKTCENNHYCCTDCIKKIKICHMCRYPIIDIDNIIYTDIFNRTDILNNNNIYEFYHNGDYSRIYGILNSYDISMLTSAKTHDDYTLYHIVFDLNLLNQNNIFVLDKHTIMYKTNSFYNNDGYLIKCTIPNNKIILDIEYTFNSSKKEAIVLKGSYEYYIVNNYTRTDISLNDFTNENK